MWMLALASVALAAAPPVEPGYRLHPARPQSMASARLAVIPGTATVFSQVPRYRFAGDRFSGDVQLAVVEATAPSIDWNHASLGRLVLGGRWHLGDEQKHVWLVEADAGVMSAQAWGSHSVETLAGWTVRTGWEGTWTPGNHTLIARVAGGLGVQFDFGSIVPFAFDSGFGRVFPISRDKHVSGVLETEFQLIDLVPSSGRLLVRVAPGDAGWFFDLGGQMSATFDAEDGTGGVVAQVGKHL